MYFYKENFRGLRKAGDCSLKKIWNLKTGSTYISLGIYTHHDIVSLINLHCIYFFYKYPNLNTYLIGYDLNKSGKDYDTLIKKIETFGTWWHHLDSTWIVKTDMTAVAIRELLSPTIDTDDELLVVRLSGEGAWQGFSQKGSDWLKTNL